MYVEEKREEEDRKKMGDIRWAGVSEEHVKNRI